MPERLDPKGGIRQRGGGGDRHGRGEHFVAITPQNKRRRADVSQAVGAVRDGAEERTHGVEGCGGVGPAPTHAVQLEAERAELRPVRRARWGVEPLERRAPEAPREALGAEAKEDPAPVRHRRSQAHAADEDELARRDMASSSQLDRDEPAE